MLNKINNSAGFLLCLVAFSGCWSACNAHLRKAITEEPEDVAAKDDCPDAARELCIEFRELRDLIPSNTLASITQHHYRSDRKFRRSMRFLQTAAFKDAARQIEESEVYQQLLQPFADAGVDTEMLDSITAILDCLLVRGDFENNARSAAIESRSLQTYGMEVFGSIPRSQFKDLLVTNLGNNSQFAAFYRIVRNSTFQRLVMNALSSNELRQPLRVLKKNYIDARQLVAEVFELFSWGPSDF